MLSCCCPRTKPSLLLLHAVHSPSGSGAFWWLILMAAAFVKSRDLHLDLAGLLKLRGCLKSLHSSTHKPHHTHPLSQGTACHPRDDFPIQLDQELMGLSLLAFFHRHRAPSIFASRSMYSYKLDESQNLCTRQSGRPEIAFAVSALVMMNLCVTLY
eukprot:1122556-Pelagomonas_calceolata.AAC.4